MGTEKFAQIRRYAVALEICLFLHQNLIFENRKTTKLFQYKSLEKLIRINLIPNS